MTTRSDDNQATLLYLMRSNIPRDREKLNKKIEKSFLDDPYPVICSLLSNGYKIGKLNDKKGTLIHYVFYYGPDCLLNTKDIFFQCEEAINYTNSAGLSHMHIACAYGIREVVEYFLHKGEDINLRDSLGWTLLHYASMYEQYEIFEYLVNNGADIEAVDRSGKTPLHLACESIAKIEDFTSCGNVRKNDFVKKTYFAYIEDSRPAFRRYYVGGLRIINLLIERKCRIDIKDKNGVTPLMSIFDDYYYEAASGLDKSVYITQPRSTMLKGVQKMQLAKLRLLLDHNANVSLADKKGDTVLHWAVRNLKNTRCPVDCCDMFYDDSIILNMVEFLLMRKADPNVRNKRGEAPLQLAIRILSSEVVKRLLEYGAKIIDVRIDHMVKRFFHYPNNIWPCLETVENLLDIIETLATYGKLLNTKENKVVLKFFLRNDIAGSYEDSGDDYDYRFKHLLNYGSLKRIKEVITKDDEFVPMLEEHLIKMDSAKIYFDQELRTLIPRITTHLLVTREKYKSEIDSMKKIALCDNMSLHDVMKMHPNDTYYYLMYKDYRKIFQFVDFDGTFTNYGISIKAHLAKSLVRNYVIESSRKYLKRFVSLNLSDLCSDMILNYLTNDDLWNLCSAINL